jgi:hypothetical protein
MRRREVNRAPDGRLVACEGFRAPPRWRRNRTAPGTSEALGLGSGRHARLRDGSPKARFGPGRGGVAGAPVSEDPRLRRERVVETAADAWSRFLLVD